MKKFLPINHREFKKLSFNDQLYIVSLKLNNITLYNEYLIKNGFGNFVDRQPDKIEKLLLDLPKENIFPKFNELFPVQILTINCGYYCNYDCVYSLRDKNIWDICVNKIVGVNIINFDIIIFDIISSQIFRWILYSKKYNSLWQQLILLSKLYFYAMERGYTVEKFFDMDHKICDENSLKIVAAMNRRMPHSKYNMDNLEKINEYMPLLYSDSIRGDIFKIIFSDSKKFVKDKLNNRCGNYIRDDYVLLEQMRYHNGYHFYPLIPIDFYMRHKKFHIKDWGLLLK